MYNYYNNLSINAILKNNNAISFFELDVSPKIYIAEIKKINK